MLGRVRFADREIGGARPRTLLAALLLDTNRMVTVDRLVDALWDEEPPASATANVRTHIWTLRRLIGDTATLVSHPGGYELVVPEDICDLHLFTRSTDSGRAALAGGEPERATKLLDRALGMWSTDRAAADVPRHGWVAARLTHLDEERRRTVEDFAESCLRLGEPRAALRGLAALLAVDPLRTRSWALRMRAHHLLGERGGVSETVREATEAFREYLGSPLDGELVRLHEEICRGRS
ncbi:BTAD domain-containing putative transcriptional regulator [Streptomyces sp. NPDC088864]|uniref:AfsR/SARP family transcriptional regulator n=1 Tax=Streptomyces sp. NPDC088864 TaxID=3365910 RepID=UPI00381EC773